MPRFQFNVYDGNDSLDTEGTDLPDLRTAQIEAIAMAGGILRERARFIRLDDDWRMEVTDDTGLILFRLDFQIVGSAAISGQKK
ncbi:DUF6894 family protein [Bradyrhizobium guangzhouense]|uniref:DUF6894 domain-containing protein n=1 Tax=Bradyrhizobium guangzhouense TaxID=1325095 RepID=A0AAE5WXF7_9BRAD|nr:hypothetical protein [Bradyrhizobium guangzhouense]QAU44690.1 hypothetical protein XH91_04550 [Bradyrhizobium guangzhouense]RXH08917.1 hypothetical protein EAS56_27560 [Bradyrhizobium guangzhouense]